MASIRPAGEFNTAYAQDMRFLRNPKMVILAIIAIAVTYYLPNLSPGYLGPTLNLLAYSIIAVQGLNILTGLCGQISLGQAAFMLVGGYASALLLTYTSLPIWLTIPAAGLVAGGVGLIFGLPSLRIKGFYLTMATLAAQFIIPWMTRNIAPNYLGGTSGSIEAPVPVIFGVALNDPVKYFYLSFTVLIITTILTNNVTRTKLGRAFVSIRDNDLAAELLGVNLFSYKLRAFFIAAALAGVAGALKAHYQRGIGTEFGYGLGESIILLGMLVIGGLGTRLGPFFGAVTLILLEDVAIEMGAQLAEVFPDQSAQLLTSFRPIFFGAVLILFLIFEPRGLAHRWNLIKVAWRLRPFAR